MPGKAKFESEEKARSPKSGDPARIPVPTRSTSRVMAEVVRACVITKSG